MKKFNLIFVLLLNSFLSFSQSNLWELTDTEVSNFSNDALKFRKSIPTTFKVYELDLQKFKNRISQAKDNKAISIDLPTADGIQRFLIEEASSISEVLSQKFPMIKSYVAKGIDNPSATARFSLGLDGFHGVIFYAGGPSFFIDPFTKDYNFYIAYSKKSLPQRDLNFRCEVEGHLDTKGEANTSQRNADDGLLRTFRLAIVCSGEYAQFHLNDQGIDNGASEAKIGRASCRERV